MVGITLSPRRRALAPIFALLTVAAFLVAAAVPAGAAPNPAPNEGGSKSLRSALEAAAKGHLEAKARLDNSKKRQLELSLELKKVEGRLTVLTAEIAVVADKSYRLGRLSAVSMLLNSASPDDFVQRAAGLDALAQRDSRQMRVLTETRQQVARAKAAMDNEVKQQKKQLAVIAKKKQDAERALAAVGGAAAGGFVSANSPLAKPAPRNGDGSWPSESCTIDDPTTSGCLTPRTLHALRQAQAAGFNHHVSCFRSGGGGEHPKGRACDFAAAKGGFENVDASGADRTYGNNLAGYYIKNASRLGVLYVIWYRQIWMPGTGWRSYNGGGSPSGDHTNHVHLSML